MKKSKDLNANDLNGLDPLKKSKNSKSTIVIVSVILAGFLFYISIIACAVGFIFIKSNTTQVTINLVDQAGTLAKEKHILSIYEPGNENDYRFVQFSESNSVTFKDVPPGQYLAHACPILSDRSNSKLIDLKKGDNISITFIYNNGYWRCVVKKKLF